MSARPIVLLGGDWPSTAIVYNHLTLRFNVARVLLEPRASRLPLLRKRLHRLGAFQVMDQLAFVAFAVPWLTFAARKRISEIKREFALDQTPIPAESVTRVPSVNHEQTVTLLREIAPAAVVVDGTRLISPQVLQSVCAPFINVHAGITPMYRGVHGAYWALVQSDPEHCGVSVHLVDEGIDTGAVLAQAVIHPTTRDSFATYPLLQVAAALPLLDEVLDRLLSGQSAPPVAPACPSKLWSHPTLFGYLRQRARGVR